MTDLPTLLPCPFCGGEAGWCTVTYCEDTVKDQLWPQATFHYVNCVERGCCTSLGPRGFETQHAAADAWNSRSPNHALVKALEPFAAVADVVDAFCKSDDVVVGKIVSGTRRHAEITAGDCRRARAALSAARSKGEPR